MDEPHPRWHPAAYGAICGVIGAACMTVVRSVARRRGLIEKTVPQVMEEHLTAPLRDESEEGSTARGALDQVMHLGYGAAMGAAYGLALGDRERGVVTSGLGLGLAAWLLGAMVVMPMTGAGRPAWRRTAKENTVDALAHLAFGLATELARDDLRTHTEPGPVEREERHRAHTG